MKQLRDQISAIDVEEKSISQKIQLEEMKQQIYQKLKDQRNAASSTKDQFTEKCL
jgi:hypothetical protein